MANGYQQSTFKSEVIRPSIASFNARLIRLREKNIPVGGALEKAGVSIGPDGLVDEHYEARHWQAFWREMVACHGPVIGLMAGDATDFRRAGVIGHVFISAPTLGHAYEYLEEHSSQARLHSDFEFFRGRKTSELRLQLRSQFAKSDLSAFCTNHDLAASQRSMWDITLEKTPVNQVRITHRDSSKREAYEQQFCCPVLFGCDVSAIVIDNTWLDKRLPGGDTNLFEQMREQGRITLERKLSISSIRVEEWLMHTDLEYADFASAAKAMMVSERTLRRRLSDEGTSFCELKNRVRYQSAKLALQHSEKSIEHISAELGFVSSSSFCQAFKRWGGVSPSAYRSGLQKDSK